MIYICMIFNVGVCTLIHRDKGLYVMTYFMSQVVCGHIGCTVTYHEREVSHDLLPFSSPELLHSSVPVFLHRSGNAKARASSSEEKT